jgi:hypothetical protein
MRISGRCQQADVLALARLASVFLPLAFPGRTLHRAEQVTSLFPES